MTVNEFKILASIILVLISSILVITNIEKISGYQFMKMKEDFNELDLSKKKELYYLWSTFGYVGLFISSISIIFIILVYLRTFTIQEGAVFETIVITSISLSLYWLLFIIFLFLPQVLFPKFAGNKLIVITIAWIIYKQFDSIWILSKDYIHSLIV